jgi:O-antigen/teichoic acid export membrane protein
MVFWRSSATGLRRQFVPVFEAYVCVQALRTLITRPSADPSRERYRRVGLTASTSYIARALTILIGFLSVPLTVHYLGAERYGVWLTISSLLLWVSLTDFGMAGNALVNVLSEAFGNDDRETARCYTASAFWALIAVAVVIGVAVAVGFRFVPWRDIFRVSNSTSTQELTLTCALVLALFALNLPLNSVRSIFNAHQDGYLAYIWGSAGGLASLLSLIAVTRFRGGLPELVIAMSGAPALVAVASAYYLFVRRYPWLAPAPSAVRWACIWRLLKLGGKYVVMQLAALGIYQSQAIIITQTLGPSKVVIFVVTYKLVALPVDLVYMGTLPFMSAFGEAKARRDWRWIKTAFKHATIASIASGVPLAAALALVAKPVILIWAGPSAIPDSQLVLWVFIYAAVGLAFMMPGQLLTGVERLEPLALSLILCAVGCVGLGIFFAPLWGLSGVAFAMAVSKVLTYWPIQVREVRRILRAAHAAVPLGLI